MLVTKHSGRILKILEGKNPPPYEVEIQPSPYCNANCQHCWAKTIEPLKGKLFENTSNIDISSHWKMKNYDIVRVRKISKKHFNGDVFNFSVEDNESYIANNIVVHNATIIKEMETFTIHDSPSGDYTYKSESGNDDMLK
jgi:hypothetical protein